MKVTTPTARRMRAMRERRQGAGLRELRLLVPDARMASVRRRVADEVRQLSAGEEADALAWIESVSEFDELAGGSAPEAR